MRKRDERRERHNEKRKGREEGGDKFTLFAHSQLNFKVLCSSL